MKKILYILIGLLPLLAMAQGNPIKQKLHEIFGDRANEMDYELYDNGYITVMYHINEVRYESHKFKCGNCYWEATFILSNVKLDNPDIPKKYMSFGEFYSKYPNLSKPKVRRDESDID